ncbi:MAG: ROK family glucokinase [Oscillospiraceae bacterium]|jgi:glucokinase|nr:ROK family glucokinase [Oscillospiraceae bacterium]
MRIGIDLGGTNIAAGLINENLEIVEKDSVKTLRGADAVVSEMEVLAHSLCSQAGLRLSDIESVGVGSPGAVDSREGIVVYSNNLEFSDVPLAAMLGGKLGLPVRIGNDANVAALGEFHAGAGRKAASMALITLGTGVGGGIILGGRIYDGFNGMAGEAGHMTVVKDGALCTCGRNGCWEAYASATGLIRMTKDAIARHPESIMVQISEERGKVSGRTAFMAARQGDQAGNEVVDEYLSYVACGIANLINLLQPAMLCVGGGISHEGAYLIERLQPLVDAELYNVGERKTEMCLAELGNDAGVIGAAML